jgi:hypothetical protein
MALNINIYPREDGSGFTATEINRGLHWIYTDIVCPHCGKEQSIPATHYLGGSCHFCGKNTDGTLG